MPFVELFLKIHFCFTNDYQREMLSGINIVESLTDIFKNFEPLWALFPQISAIVKKQYTEKIKCVQLQCFKVQ